MKKNNFFIFALVVISIVLLNIISSFSFFRLDLTSEKRYSISENTKNLIGGLDKDMHINIYLDGDLNPGLLRLKKSTKELLDEFKVYTSEDLSYEFINPSAAGDQEERNKKYIALEQRGMRAFTLFEKDDEGKSIQKVLFPWAEIIYNNDTNYVNLLKNNPNLSGDENLNTSIENLEFGLTDAIRLMTNKTKQKVAFLEGHGELPEEYVFDAQTTLSKYFDIRRGQIGSDPGVLNDFKVLVIAKPVAKFSEQEKFIIDQYIMNGGRVLWLLEGARLEMDSLSSQGMSPIIPLDINLDDMLFKYGVRIFPVIIQDMQCIQVPINVAREDEAAKFEPMPWYYSPLLVTRDHPITCNLLEVKAEFCSALDTAVSKNPNIKKTELLATSDASHVISIPNNVDVVNIWNIDPGTYFNVKHAPVAALLEGKFPSVFTNRLVPDSIFFEGKIKTESKPTRMIVVADGDIIRNDIQGSGNDIQLIPMGFDRLTKLEYGNRNFILNSILYLTDDEGWLQLRSRDFKLRMLNKKKVVSERKTWQIINIASPLLILLLFAFIYSFLRRKFYIR